MFPQHFNPNQMKSKKPSLPYVNHLSAWDIDSWAWSAFEGKIGNIFSSPNQSKCLAFTARKQKKKLLAPSHKFETFYVVTKYLRKQDNEKKMNKRISKTDGTCLGASWLSARLAN